MLMTPQKLSQDLKAAGISYSAQAKALKTMGYDTSQATIHRIASGSVNPKWKVVEGLTRLHATVCGKVAA
jgi:predicted transcriptional regulator